MSEPIKSNYFKCALCGGVFEKANSDEEAEAEMKDIWGDEMTVGECGVVCDDCFNKICPSELKYNLFE